MSSIFSLSLAIPLLLLNFIQVFDNLNAQCIFNLADGFQRHILFPFQHLGYVLLGAAAGSDGVLAFEGNPAFIAQEDLEKIDLFVLASETAENAYTLRNIVLDAQDWGVAKEKMLLAADFNGAFYDSENASADVLTSIADQTVILGPMAGLALYNIESDYYHSDGDWLTVRSLISRLNP